MLKDYKLIHYIVLVITNYSWYFKFNGVCFQFKDLFSFFYNHLIRWNKHSSELKNGLAGHFSWTKSSSRLIQLMLFDFWQSLAKLSNSFQTSLWLKKYSIVLLFFVAIGSGNVQSTLPVWCALDRCMAFW